MFCVPCQQFAFIDAPPRVCGLLRDRRAAAPRARGPGPSDNGISPVSINCLNRCRSSWICWSGSSPNSQATLRPRAPPGGEYCSCTRTSVPRAPGRRGEAHRAAVLHVRSFERSPGDPLVLVIADRLGLPLDAHAGRPGCAPARPAIAGDLHGFEVAHEAREVLEVLPELVDVLDGPAHGGHALHLHALDLRPQPPGAGPPGAQLLGADHVERGDAQDSGGGRRDALADLRRRGARLTPARRDPARPRRPATTAMWGCRVASRSRGHCRSRDAP